MQIYTFFVIKCKTSVLFCKLYVNMTTSKSKKRLSFLRVFMKEHKITGKRAAEILGMPLRSWQKKIEIDNLDFSMARNIAASVGYRIEVRFSTNKELQEKNKDIIWRPRVYESDAVAFINEVLDRHNFQNVSLIEAGISPHTIITANKKGDIKISIIYKVAEALKVRVRFKFIKMETEQVKIKGM